MSEYLWKLSCLLAFFTLGVNFGLGADDPNPDAPAPILLSHPHRMQF